MYVYVNDGDFNVYIFFWFLFIWNKEDFKILVGRGNLILLKRYIFIINNILIIFKLLFFGFVFVF